MRFFHRSALNPYLMAPRAMGLPFGSALPASDTWANKLPNNAYNSMELRRASGSVTKTGPTGVTAGEAFFYKGVQALLSIRSFFPHLHSVAESGGADASDALSSPTGAASNAAWESPAAGTITLTLEFIPGVPATTLFAYPRAGPVPPGPHLPRAARHARVRGGASAPAG